MNTICNIRLTPEKVVENGLNFGIPIYQRLFAWDGKQVYRLMDNLYQHYKSHEYKDTPYYIGALSCVRLNNRYDLIDGQQRMTVMCLIGIAVNKDYKFQSSWGKFLSKGDRLHFIARSADSSYFQGRILGQVNGAKPNALMEEGISTIDGFLQNQVDSELRDDFCQWIFKNLSFFISILPSSYEGDKNLLNKYFENMNVGGRGLEEHDILKVQLIQGQPHQRDLIRIWNTACDLSQKAIKLQANESASSYAEKYRQAISLCRKGDIKAAMDMCIGSYEEDDATTIGEILPISDENEMSYDTPRNPSLISISEFLLMVLDLQNYNENVQNKESFYEQQLLRAFSDEIIHSLDIPKFYEDILLCRLLLDYYFISLEREDWGLNYDLALYSDEKEKMARCRQFEAMLYVSDTPLYHWITPLMHKLKNEGNLDADKLLNELKALDRKYRGSVEYDQLFFPEVKVYWFRRLEYLIWENRRELFKQDEHSLAVADDYRFVSNRRSREHIIPQTPKSESNLRWDDSDEDTAIMNSFGNLVLISSSLNSKLSNESYDVKKAYVQSYQKRSMGGAIESLSLLLFHTKFPDLDRDNMRDYINEYGSFTYNDILKKSF